MHNESLSRLRDIIHFQKREEVRIPIKAKWIQPFTLLEKESIALIWFLKSLTDEQ